MSDELEKFAKEMEGLSIDELRERLKKIRKSRIEKVAGRPSSIDKTLRRKVMDIRDMIEDDDEFVI